MSSKQNTHNTIYKPGFPAKFYTKLSSFIDVKGKKVLDVGCSSSSVTLELAKRGASVVCLNESSNQMEAAKQLSQQRGLADKCTFIVATAEDTKQPKEEFDLVTAGTCWHCFDKPKACKEIQRVLKPGGLFVVAQYEYLAEPNSLVEGTEKLILEYYPNWTPYSCVYPQCIQELTDGGFEFEEMICFDHQQHFTHEGWLNYIQATNNFGVDVSQAQADEFSTELLRFMNDKYPVNLAVKHRMFMVVTRKPGTFEATQWFHIKSVTVTNIVEDHKVMHVVQLHLGDEMPIQNACYNLNIGHNIIEQYYACGKNAIEFRVHNMHILQSFFNQPIKFYEENFRVIPTGINFPDMSHEVDLTIGKHWTHLTPYKAEPPESILFVL